GVEKLHAYSVAFALAAAAGYVSTYYLASVPEPVMKEAPPVPVLAMLRSPFRDTSFRKVIAFMGAWNVASNISAPFITVYLLQQLGYAMGTVTALWISSQIANALTM